MNWCWVHEINQTINQLWKACRHGGIKARTWGAKYACSLGSAGSECEAQCRWVVTHKGQGKAHALVVASTRLEKNVLRASRQGTARARLVVAGRSKSAPNQGAKMVVVRGRAGCVSDLQGIRKSAVCKGAVWHGQWGHKNTGGGGCQLPLAPNSGNQRRECRW